MNSCSFSPARGRLAPSPTGPLHLGNAYAFLAAWLSIRRQNGSLALRFEDIDPDRSRAGFADAILRDLEWLGITWDKGPGKGLYPGGLPGPCVQSRRLDVYGSVMEDLAGRGLVYPCYCTRKELRSLASAPHTGDEGVPYPGTCRELSAQERAGREREGRRACLRLHTERASGMAYAGNPARGEASPVREATRQYAFTDGVLGERRFSMGDCGGDFALRRSDGVYSYQLAVVTDDAAMGVTEVVRGEDLLLSTPRQLLLFQLQDRPAPRYAHIPLLLDAQGQRLAKRHKGLEVAALRATGLTSEQVVGYLGWLAGWQPGLAAPVPAKPHDLLESFSFNALRGRRLQLPEHPEDIGSAFSRR